MYHCITFCLANFCRANFICLVPLFLDKNKIGPNLNINFKIAQPSVTSSLGGSRGVNLDKTQDYNQQSNHNDTLGSLSTALHKGKSMPSLR